MCDWCINPLKCEECGSEICEGCNAKYHPFKWCKKCEKPFCSEECIESHSCS